MTDRQTAAGLSPRQHYNNSAKFQNPASLLVQRGTILFSCFSAPPQIIPFSEERGRRDGGPVPCSFRARFWVIGAARSSRRDAYISKCSNLTLCLPRRRLCLPFLNCSPLYLSSPDPPSRDILTRHNNRPQTADG